MGKGRVWFGEQRGRSFGAKVQQREKRIHTYGGAKQEMGGPFDRTSSNARESISEHSSNTRKLATGAKKGNELLTDARFACEDFVSLWSLYIPTQTTG